MKKGLFIGEAKDKINDDSKWLRIFSLKSLLKKKSNGIYEIRSRKSLW